MDLSEMQARAQREILALPDDAGASDEERRVVKAELVTKVNGFHEAMVDWWVANPAGTLDQCSRQFGYSRTWICKLMQTDMFKERLAKRQDELFGEVRFTLKDRLEALAVQTIDRMLTRVDVMRDDDLRDAAKLSLEAMGVTGPRASIVKISTGPQQHNTYVISKDDLANARQLMHKVTDQLPSPAAPQLPSTIERHTSGDD